MCQAVGEGSLGGLLACLRAEDQYPPGHSLLLGLWMVPFGDGMASRVGFRVASLWLCAWGLWLIGGGIDPRRREAFLLTGCVLLMMNVEVLVLAGTFMVEVPAVGLLLVALGALGHAGRSGRPLPALWAGLAVLAVLLTKHNLGLPLIPAGFALAGFLLLKRRRRPALLVALASVVALAGWAAFLTWQRNGWQSFLAFAENRSSSGGATPWWRLGWYARLYAHQFSLHPLLAVLVAGAALASIGAGAGDVVTLALAYLVTTAAALGLHAYNLDRNLLAASVVLIVPAAIGVSRLPVGRWRRIPGARGAGILGVAVVAALLVGGAVRARQGARSFLPPDQATLARASDFVAAQMASATSARVVGTFDWFSAGWMHILARRSPRRDGLRLAVDFPYPGQASRTGYDPGPSPRYGEAVAAWLQGGGVEDVIITIDVADGSVFDDEDYRLWNAWKRNYGEAIAATLGDRMAAEMVLGDGALRLRAYRSETGNVLFGKGWGPAEGWGRWAMEKEAVLTVTAPGAEKLDLECAPFEGLSTPQEVQVFCGGVRLESFTVQGEPWAWQHREVRLPAPIGPARRDLVFRFARLYHGNDGDEQWRCLPVRNLKVR